MPLKPSFPVSPCPRCPKSRRSVCHCFLKHVPASAAAAEDDSAMVRTRCAVCCEKRPNVFCSVLRRRWWWWWWLMSVSGVWSGRSLAVAVSCEGKGNACITRGKWTKETLSRNQKTKEQESCGHSSVLWHMRIRSLRGRVWLSGRVGENQPSSLVWQRS